MKDFDVEYLGNYRPAASGRAADKLFWTSDVVLNGTTHRVVDAAGMDPSGRNIVNLVPYGANGKDIDELVGDGDLLAYIRGRNVVRLGMNVDMLLPLLKGRASHAELCYRSSEDHATHVSLWDAPNPICPTDCRVFCDHTDNAALGIYRVSLAGYGVSPDREKTLKAEVRKWKKIVSPVYFPNGFALNFDPVDFASVEALGGIGRKFLCHSPNDWKPPVDFRLNCVQWSTLVLSLAVCYPLTESTIVKLNARNEFESNWMSHVGGYCVEVEGLNELPVPFYSPMEVVENALDLYLPEERDKIMALAANCPVEAILKSKGLMSDHRVVMPSAFIIENRLRNLGVSRKTKSVFEYVATALPERELVRVG